MLNKKIVAALAVLLCTLSLWGATCTWTNASSDVQWTTAANWDGNGVPTAADDVIIPAGPDYPRLPPNATITVNNLQVAQFAYFRGTSTTSFTVKGDAEILGNMDDMGSFTVYGAAKVNYAFTQGEQLYKGPVELELTGSQIFCPKVTFEGDVTSGKLTVNYATEVTFKGTVDIEEFSPPTQGATITIYKNFTTVKSQTYSGGQVIIGDGTGNSVTLQTTGTDRSILFYGQIAQNGNIPCNLTILTSKVSLYAQIASETKPLASLTVGSDSIAPETTIYAPNITTVGAQIYWGKIVLGGFTSFGCSDITFHQTITNIQQFFINASDTVNFHDTAKFARLTVTGRTSTDTPITTIYGDIETTDTQTTAPGQSYGGPVIIAADVTLVSKNSIEFKGTIDGISSGVGGLTILAGINLISFFEAVGDTNPFASLTVLATARIYANITTTGNQTYDAVLLASPNSSAPVTFTSSDGNITFVRGPIGDSTYTTIKQSLRVTAANGIATFTSTITDMTSLQVTAIQCAFGGQISTTTPGAIIITGEVYFFGSYISIHSATGVTIDGDLHIATSVMVTYCPLTARNIVLYSGQLVIMGALSITTTEDLVLLNGDPATMYDDPVSGVSGLFRYDHPARDKTNTTDNNPLLAGANVELKKKFPSTVLTPFPTTYSGTVIATNGSSITVSKNFYNNGAGITATAPWTLKIPSNDDATAAFAEAYNMSVENCTVQAISGSHAIIAAIEKCSGINSDIDLTDGAGWVFDLTALSATNIKTLSDSIIQVEIDDSGAQGLKFENSNGEIADAVAAIKSGNGTESFFGAYTDAACTQKIVAGVKSSDVAVFYLKTATPAWNTDATGLNAGDPESTDSAGIHHTTPADLEIPKATTALFQILRDSNKNRLPNYVSTNRFTAVTDGAPPVVAAVYLGQEAHTVLQMGNLSSQAHYDGHNFIEFRYSEPVTIGGITTNEGVQASTQFSDIEAESGGAITSASGLNIAGYGKIAGGVLTSKKGSSNDNTVHSVYRHFSTKSSSAASDQKHRVRIGIAAFSMPDAEYKYRVWEGYVTAITAPANNTAVNIPANLYISDMATTPNTLKAHTSTVRYAALAVDDANNTADFIGGWDTFPPTIAMYANTSYGEIVVANHSTVTKLEFHLHDGVDSSKYDWLTATGWFTAGTTALIAPAPDTRGGSRPFAPTAAKRTGGGIRYSTWQGAASDFLYTVDGGTLTPGILLTTYVTAPYFAAPTEIPDNLFFNLELADLIGRDAVYTLQYSPVTSHITDLAGNLLQFPKKNVILQKALTITLSIAPYGSNKLLLVFSSPLVWELTNPIWATWYKGADPLVIIPKQLSLTNANINIDGNTPAILRFSSDRVTALELTLTGKVTFDSLTNSSINVSGSDGASAIGGSNVPAIFDLFGNNLRSGKAHALSDFAVGFVEPLYAVENKDAATAGQSGGWAVRDFSGVKNALNAISAGRDITIAAKLRDLDPSDPTNIDSSASTVTETVMYLSIAPDADSVASKFSALLGRASRVWLPIALPNFSERPNPPDGENTRALKPNSASVPPLFSFFMPNDTTTTDAFNWQGGSTVGFLFELHDGNGIITIDHDADGTPDMPLYALRLADPNDLLSIDLWSFRLTGASQRGNVVIANNVINALIKESVRIEVDMPSAGNLTVSVMTLDGNIVKYLQRGRINAGKHSFSWNGTTNGGATVARGMYFVRIVAPGIDETRKVMVVKE